jgi:primase-polymerase (primpol)-like protein
MIHERQIPAELKAEPQWLCWRTEHHDGKPTKVPVTPETDEYGSVADPDTWTGFDTAYDYHHRSGSVDGIGFVFTRDDPYLGADLDDCRSPATGALMEWAKKVITQLDSYTEVSPSGTGVHVIAKAEFPYEKHRSGDLELYSDGRFFTMTGDHLTETPSTVNERTDTIAAIYEEYIADDADDADKDRSETSEPAETTTLEDDELLEKARNASNGDKFERLWNGDTSGYPSHSEADQALANMLAFWTGGDAAQIERLFNRSGLTRQKWSERSDYRERTIQKAIRDCPAHYDPDSDADADARS